MKTTRIAPVLLFSFALAFWFLFGTPHFARAESVRIQPAIIEERLEPGAVYSVTLRVTNLDPIPQTFYLFSKDVQSVDDTGKPTFTEEKNPLYGLSSWITLPGPSVTVASGETKEIPIVITAPKDAAPGGHFGGVFVSLRAVKPSETGVGTGYEVGTIVSMRVAGEVLEQARIREFRTDKTIYETPNVPFSARVENLGNVLVRPRGPIQITDMFGKQVATIVVNEEGARIFPKAERTFTAGWTSDNALAFGRYQATISMNYGEDSRETITATVSFWVLPVKIIAGILGSLLVLIIIFVLGVRFYVRKKVREVQGGNVSSRPDALMPPSRLLVFTIAAVLFVLLLLFAVFFLFGS